MSTPTTATLPDAKQHPQTGPRTPEGKARSAQNARKHGLTSASPFIAPEDRPAYDELEASLRDETKAFGALEEIPFQAALANAWNLRRLTRFEAECADMKELIKLQRYRASAERCYYRAIKEIATQQAHALAAANFRAIAAVKAAKQERSVLEMSDEEFYDPEVLTYLRSLGTPEESFKRWQEEQATTKSA